jgi:hypothetical protein
MKSGSVIGFFITVCLVIVFSSGCGDKSEPMQKISNSMRSKDVDLKQVIAAWVDGKERAINPEASQRLAVIMATLCNKEFDSSRERQKFLSEGFQQEGLLGAIVRVRWEGLLPGSRARADVEATVGPDQTLKSSCSLLGLP